MNSNLSIVVAALLTLTAAPGVAATCESLASLSLPDTTITTAQVVPAGGFKLPQGNNASFENLPEFCRVAATLKPTSDSDIRIEVWLPTSGWNGKYEGVGSIRGTEASMMPPTSAARY